METRTIECVAFFFLEGAKGDDFIQKISLDAASIPVSGEVSWGGGHLGIFSGVCAARDSKLAPRSKK